MTQEAPLQVTDYLAQSIYEDFDACMAYAIDCAYECEEDDYDEYHKCIEDCLDPEPCIQEVSRKYNVPVDVVKRIIDKCAKEDEEGLDVW